MSKRLDPLLPDRLFHRLSGEHLPKLLNQVVLLVTVDENGWPYPSMLSYLEVVALDRRNLRIAPWNNSTTTSNLRKNGKATLLIIDEGMAYYLQGTAAELASEMTGFSGIAKINISLESVLEDKALDYEGSARVATGVQFENPQMDAGYIERGRRVLAALRQ